MPRLTRGTLVRTVTSVPLDQVESLEFQRTIPGRVLGFGSLAARSAGAVGIHRFGTQFQARGDFLGPNALYQQRKHLVLTCAKGFNWIGRIASA